MKRTCSKNQRVFISFFFFLCFTSTNVAQTTERAFTTLLLPVIASTAGGLSTAITTSGYSLATLTEISITGTIDARDFVTLRDNMPLLSNVDMSAVTIGAYNGNAGTNSNIWLYPANELPQFGFCTSNWIGKATLNSVVIPSSVTSLGMLVFYGCHNLTTVTIPTSVVSIGSSAFSYCNGLSSVTIPFSVTAIGSDAFNGCTGLTTIVIPSTVKSIGDEAFYLCNKLVSATIPSSVISIGVRAFYACSSLLSLYAYSPTPVSLSTGSYVFYSVPGTCVLHVPTGAKTAYLAATQWNVFNIVEDLLSSGVNAVTEQTLKVNVQNGQVVITGVRVGETITICTLQGCTIYCQQAVAPSVTVNLPMQGVYIVQAGVLTVKVLSPPAGTDL